MNICIIAPAFPSKRNPIINIFIYRQAKALVERGHKVFVIGGDTEPREEGGMIVYARPNPFKSVLLAFRTMLKIPKESLWLFKNIGLRGTVGRLSLVQMTCNLLEKENIDVIDGNYAQYGGIAAYLIYKIYRKLYITTCHGADIMEVTDAAFRLLHEGERQIVSLVLKNSKCVLVPSQDLANYTRIYCSDCSIKVVFNSVDLNFFKPSNKKIFKKRTVICVGALNSRKGHRYLLHAIKYVINKIKDVNFIIIGRGPEEQNLKKLAQELDILNYVTFIDFIPEEQLPLYYSSSEFFVLATLYDSFGIVFAEAMACGIPVVSTNIDTLKEVVDGCGILVEPKNPDQLAEAMLKLLNDEALRQELGKKALVQARKFSIETRIDKIEEIYKTCKINSE
jgi:glycosyltransferase involved in cell wall biosynthesis